MEMMTLWEDVLRHCSVWPLAPGLRVLSDLILQKVDSLSASTAGAGFEVGFLGAKKLNNP